LTPSGFPVGIELLGRPFAEPMLIAIGYAYEQATHHRRPPASAPRALADALRSAATLAAADPIALDVLAVGAQAHPACEAHFHVKASLRVDERTGIVVFELAPAGRDRHEIAGVYLHRRTTRPNGGVAHVLAKSLARPVSGSITLLDAELADLKAGKCY